MSNVTCLMFDVYIIDILADGYFLEDIFPTFRSVLDVTKFHKYYSI